MHKRRRSYEQGHRPKFLAIVDDTPECAPALRFALRRATRTGAGLVLLAVVTPPEGESWLGVGELMHAEALEEANGLLEAAASALAPLSALKPELVARAGGKAEEISALIDQDEDISILVLGAGTGRKDQARSSRRWRGACPARFPCRSRSCRAISLTPRLMRWRDGRACIEGPAAPKGWRARSASPI